MTPLPLTGGSELPKTSVLLDWISVTFPRSAKPVFPSGLSEVYVPHRPFNAYNIGQRFEDGRILLQHTTRPEMGTHVICSGETLRNMPVAPEECLKFWLDSGARVTRLDVAIDALNHRLKPIQATRYIKKGKVRTRAKEFPTWRDAKETGYTQYIGKKSSEVYCRIYDKGAEMGTKQDHTRIECIFGQERADKAAREIVRGKDPRSLVRGFVDFPEWSAWGRIMGDSIQKLPAERVTSKSREWLLRSCAPALARELMLSDGEEFVTQFLDAVHEFKKTFESNQKVAGD